MTHEQLARVGYEANRAYSAAIGECNPPWEAAAEEDRVLWVLAARFAVDNPFGTAEDLHDAWCLAELALGWTYGPVLDNDRRRHPHLVAWDRLPEPQRRKVALFLAIVRALVF